MPLSELHIMQQWESHTIVFLDKRYLDEVVLSGKTALAFSGVDGKWDYQPLR
jgi:hypothetical protein